MPDPAPTALPVDEARHWSRLMQMAELGAIPGPSPEDRGVNRPCLSPLDREARRLLIRWAGTVGLTVSIDEIGNLFLRHEGTDPSAAPVLSGSHMDSQPNGGRFDGIWGVLAAFEAVQAIRDAGIATRRPIEVVAWTNEEGGRFAPGCMGSMAWAGIEPPSAWDAVTDTAGTTFRQALDEHLAAEADLPRRALGPTGGPSGRAPHAYVEAHIEQGPLLEAEGLDIGVVSGIQGSRWFTVEISGKTDHAGTAPLRLRQDAVQDMLRAITALNALTHDPADVLRFTVGKVEVLPNSSNTVADTARFSVDLRHPDATVLMARGDAIAGVVQAAVRHCRATVRERFHALPTTFDPRVPEAVERAAASLGLRARRLASGAFHDAQFVGSVCPSGMIFVPSRAGISHHPAEYTSSAQLAAGTRALAATLLDLAQS
ncbi:M20 family metallo-hydrolase [Teichococcus vastitatis]|uniref:M20 family metallo-hydrolase n=1 Tax=Teichococcus vastitatis TaxID=2307076 RepID=A0ABS9W0Z3_9PROT|nr:M20 family metallo-hydrolase [Pseudoroseomonas vastitatis]MCI0752882.1 M20 family metallo-hydrolase [Pseudoroseomonas vastitatis]